MDTVVFNGSVSPYAEPPRSMKSLIPRTNESKLFLLARQCLQRPSDSGRDWHRIRPGILEFHINETLARPNVGNVIHALFGLYLSQKARKHQLMKCSDRPVGHAIRLKLQERLVSTLNGHKPGEPMKRMSHLVKRESYVPRLMVASEHSSMERLLWATNRYLEYYFKPSPKISKTSPLVLRREMDGVHQFWPGESLGLITQPVAGPPQREKATGIYEFSKVFGQMPEIILQGCPTTLLNLIQFLSLPAWDDLPNKFRFRRCLLYHLSCMALEIYGPMVQGGIMLMEAHLKKSQHRARLGNSPLLLPVVERERIEEEFYPSFLSQTDEHNRAIAYCILLFIIDARRRLTISELSHLASWALDLNFNQLINEEVEDSPIQSGKADADDAVSPGRSENSTSSLQDFGELSETHSSFSTPQTSVTISQSGFGSPSDSELSFVDANNDSNIENALFEKDSAFVQELAQRTLLRCLKVASKYGVTTRTESEGKSTTSCPSDLTISSSTGKGTGGKRAHQNGGERDNFDGEGDDPNENARKKRVCKDSPVPFKLFACPYWKHDPERYSGNNLMEKEKCYRRCASTYLKDISRLKQHLWRVHRRPDYFCCICFATFESQALLFHHTKQRSCNETDNPFHERISEEQLTLIKRRNKNGDHVKQWYGIFRILFPHQPEPVSPYTEGNGAVDHFAALFRWFGPEEFLDLLRDRRDRGGRSLDMSTRLIALEAFERALPGFLGTEQCPFTAMPAGNRELETSEPEEPQSWADIPQQANPPNENASNEDIDNFLNFILEPVTVTTLSEWSETQPPPASMLSIGMEDAFQEQILGWTDPIDPTEAYDAFDVFGLDREDK